MSPRYPDQQGIDLNTAVARLAGKTALLNKLLHSFLDKYLDAPATIKKFIENEQQEDARSLSHQIKGAAANLGADAVSESARVIEQQLKQNIVAISDDDFQNLQVKINELKDYVELYCIS